MHFTSLTDDQRGAIIALKSNLSDFKSKELIDKFGSVLTPTEIHTRALKELASTVSKDPDVPSEAKARLKTLSKTKVLSLKENITFGDAPKSPSNRKDRGVAATVPKASASAAAKTGAGKSLSTAWQNVIAALAAAQ